MWGDSKARATSKKKKKKEKLLSISKEMSSGSTTMDPDLSAAVQGDTSFFAIHLILSLITELPNLLPNFCF